MCKIEKPSIFFSPNFEFSLHPFPSPPTFLTFLTNHTSHNLQSPFTSHPPITIHQLHHIHQSPVTIHHITYYSFSFVNQEFIMLEFSNHCQLTYYSFSLSFRSKLGTCLNYPKHPFM